MALGSIFSLPDSVFLICVGSNKLAGLGCSRASDRNRAQDRQEGRETPIGKPSANRGGGMSKILFRCSWGHTSIPESAAQTDSSPVGLSCPGLSSRTILLLPLYTGTNTAFRSLGHPGPGLQWPSLGSSISRSVLSCSAFLGPLSSLSMWDGVGIFWLLPI